MTKRKKEKIRCASIEALYGIVEDIENLTDNALNQAWEQLDESIQELIKDAWQIRILRAFGYYK